MAPQTMRTFTTSAHHKADTPRGVTGSCLISKLQHFSPHRFIHCCAPAACSGSLPGQPRLAAAAGRTQIAC